MTTNPETDVLAALVRLEAKHQGWLSTWVKEHPVRRSRLLLWMLTHTDTEAGLAEILDARLAASVVRSVPDHDAEVRQQLQAALAVWDAGRER